MTVETNNAKRARLQLSVLAPLLLLALSWAKVDAAGIPPLSVVQVEDRLSHSRTLLEESLSAAQENTVHHIDIKIRLYLPLKTWAALKQEDFLEEMATGLGVHPNQLSIAKTKEETHRDGKHRSTLVYVVLGEVDDAADLTPRSVSMVIERLQAHLITLDSVFGPWLLERVTYEFDDGTTKEEHGYSFDSDGEGGHKEWMNGSSGMHFRVILAVLLLAVTFCLMLLLYIYRTKKENRHYQGMLNDTNQGQGDGNLQMSQL